MYFWSTLSVKNDPDKKSMATPTIPPAPESPASASPELTFHKTISDESLFSYFVREIAALTMVKKAGVAHTVQLKAVRPDGSLILEKYDGDLHDVDSETISQHITRIIYQILVTMFHFQLLDLAHRDIKPENVLISNDCQQVAVCDFGLSRYYSNGQCPAQCTSAVQTAFYRSPEVLFREIGDTASSGLSTYVDIGDVNPNNMDIWSLGVSILRLLDLLELCPPQLMEDEITLDELYDLYEQLYGPDGQLIEFNRGRDTDPEADPEITELIWLACDMLVINSNLRPDAETLLRNTIFDKYRTEEELESIKSRAKQFEQERVARLLKVLPETESDPQVLERLVGIAHYQFNNVESLYLAACILYLLPDTDRKTIDVVTVIGLATTVFDSDIMYVNIPETVALFAKLDYDLMLPVMHDEVRHRLVRLFSTV